MRENNWLPRFPKIPEAVLVRHKGLLRGPIAIGEVFAWEPDLPHARELVVVVELTGKSHRVETTVKHPLGTAVIAAESGAGVRTRALNGNKLCWNDMSRFLEAATRTKYQHMPSELQGGTDDSR